jgi:hypothetical protein
MFYTTFQAFSSYLVLPTNDVLKFQVLFRTIGINILRYAEKYITISLNIKIQNFTK